METPPIVPDFDIEKVKASGLFIAKDDYDTTIKNYAKQLEDAKNSGFKKYFEKIDNVSAEIATLTGIERLEIEKDGKKEKEQLNDHVKRALAAKNAEPLEKEKQLRDIFSKREKELLAENQLLETNYVHLRYSNELQGAMSELLVGITDKEEYANSQRLVNSLVMTEFPNKEYSKEHNRFIYKDSQGEIIRNKIADPISTNEILAEVAKILPQKQQQRTAPITVLGRQNNANNPQITVANIFEMVDKESPNLSSTNPILYFAKIRELGKNYGLTINF